jgi:hypothetical protein
MDCKTRLLESDAHPLGKNRAVEFFKFTIQRFFQNGKYVQDKNEPVGNDPYIFRDPVLFLGNRSQGFAEALDRFIDGLPTLEILPEALMRIVGIETVNQKIIADQILVSSDEHQASLTTTNKTDYLLTKAANAEQERIINRLEQFGSVLVQGPPGTGKTHTIANIIGHLLANGKTVLVSSHTAKALNVVRDKVAPSLQPLCVSVLDNDTKSKEQLEESPNE